MIDDLMVGHRLGRLTESPDDVERHVSRREYIG